jgi:hypothetical protein
MAVCGSVHVEVELSLVHGNAEGEAPPEYGVWNWHAMLIFIFNPLQCIDILLMLILLGIDPSSPIWLWFIKHSTFSCKHKSLAFRCIDGKEELYTTLRKREHHARQQYPLELISGTGHKCRSLRRWPMPEHRIVSGRLAEKKVLLNLVRQLMLYCCDYLKTVLYTVTTVHLQILQVFSILLYLVNIAIG